MEIVEGPSPSTQAESVIEGNCILEQAAQEPDTLATTEERNVAPQAAAPAKPEPVDQTISRDHVCLDGILKSGMF